MRKNKKTLFPYKSLAAITGLIIFLSGILVITGWRFNIDPLKNFGLGSVNMKPFTGLCFALTGLSLSLLYSKNKWIIIVSRVLSVAIVSAGLISLLEFIVQINFGVEDILFRNFHSPHPFPGMLSFNTSVCVFLSGVFLLFLSTRPNRFSYPAALILVIIFSVGFIGFASSFIGFSGYSEHTGFYNMSVLTSILLMLVSLGSLMFYLAYCARRITIEQKFYSTAVFIFTIIAFITILTNMEFQSLREANFEVEKNRIIKSKLNQSVSEVLEVESAVRGYLLSGNADYLQFMDGAKASVAMIFTDLQKLLAGEPSQLIRMDSLKILIEKRIEHAGLVLNATKTDGTDSGMALFMTNKGKELTDNIRSIADTMISFEDTKIKESNNAAEERASKTLSFIFINLGIEVILLLLFFMFLGNNIRKRKDAIEEIILLNQKLDEMVRQRTAELAESEAKYRDIVESSLVGVFSRSMQGGIVYANEAFANIVEVDDAMELIGTTPHNFYLNQDARRAFIDKLQMDGYVRNFEADLITLKGNVKTIEVTAKLRGKVITGMIYDITDRKKAELALEESEAKLRLIMENSADPICLVNLKGEFLYANRATSKIFGYTPEEIKTKTVADVTSSRLQSEIQPKIFKLLNEGKLFIEWSVLKKDNSVITVEINAVVLPDGVIYASFRDISQRKKEQEEINLHRDNLAKLVEEKTKEINACKTEMQDIYDNAPCGYYSLAPDGKIVNINNTALAWLGYSRDEVLEKMRIEDILNTESQKKFSDDFNALTDTNRMVNKEYEYKRRDGSTFSGMTNSAAVFDPGNRLMRCNSSITVISGQNQFERRS